MCYLRVLILILLGSVAISSAQADTIASLTFFFDGPTDRNQPPAHIFVEGEATFTFNYSPVLNAPLESDISVRVPDLLTFGLMGTAALATPVTFLPQSTTFSIGLTDLTAFDYTFQNTGNVFNGFADLSFSASPVASSNPNFGPALMDIRYISHEGGADITFPQNIYGLSTPGVGDAFSNSLVLTTQPTPPTPTPEPSAVGSLLLSAVLFAYFRSKRIR